MCALATYGLPAYSPLSATAILRAVGGRLLHGAEEIEQARTLIAAEYEASQAVVTDSGRSALRLAISASLPKPPARRIVALPAFQCFEVATAAVGAGCRIALYDIDPATLRPDLESLEKALRIGAAAVVIAPLYGLPVDWDAIVEMTARHGAALIEDAAQADGAAWNGRRLGTLGQLSVVSFGRGKGWTGGGGGALLIRRGSPASSIDLNEPLVGMSAQREMRTAAAALLQLVFGRASLYGIPAAIPSLGLGETRYHAPTIPTTASPFSAALIRRTLEAARLEASVRRDNASRWNARLPSNMLKGVPPVVARGTAGYLRFPLRLPANVAAAAGTGAGRRAGIARSYPQPLGQLPAVAPLLVERANAPGAEALARELVTLPTHSRLTQASRERILGLCAALATRLS